MPVLSPHDHAFFDEHGYVIVPDAVPQSDLDALVAMIDRLVGLDPRTWYRPPHHDGAFVEAYHQQELWNTRQRPRVHAAFAELFGTERLLVGVDRASMKLPMHPDHDPAWGGALPMHWDVHMDGQPRVGFQGVLAITDTTPDMGGFACVPGSHKRVAEIVARQSPGFNGMRPRADDDLRPQAIAMKAGDLLIWTVQLLHGSAENRSTRPRLAQYIKFGQAPSAVTQEELDARRAAFAKLEPPGGWKPNPPVDQPAQWACRALVPPSLTELGRKIAGLDAW